MSTNGPELAPKISEETGVRDWISGFLLLGILIGLLGSLLVAWQYHIDADPKLIGLHFLAFSAGYVTGAAAAQQALPRFAMRSVAVTSCVIGFASLAALSFLTPPAPNNWRIVGLASVGIASGILASSLLYILRPYFSRSPAALTNRAGALFGGGCLLSTCIVGALYFAGSVQLETAVLALAPLVFLVVFATNKFPVARKPAPPSLEEDRLRQTLRDLRSIGAVLFSLLLFFQFGNEWAIAGWLPLFLIHRLGANPVWAIFSLAAYFLALMVGRLVVQHVLRSVSHTKLLFGSTLGAMGGCLLLSLTPWMTGAWLAVTIIGASFAPIYPLIAEILDHRFSYHPGFYNGLLSLAIMGAMLAPWLLGFVDSYLGVQYVMLIPAFGSITVLILALLIKLEARLMSGEKGGLADRQASLANKD